MGNGLQTYKTWPESDFSVPILTKAPSYEGLVLRVALSTERLLDSYVHLKVLTHWRILQGLIHKRTPSNVTHVYKVIVTYISEFTDMAGWWFVIGTMHLDCALAQRLQSHFTTYSHGTSDTKAITVNLMPTSYQPEASSITQESTHHVWSKKVPFSFTEGCCIQMQL